jgi:hypothetical protein
MKKLLVCIMTVTSLLTFNPNQSMGATKTNPPSTEPSAATVAKINVMVNRLNEIDAMDKSTLSASEKKELRKEVRVIKKEIKRSGGGVYLSVGALLLIIILLIVLL